MLNPDDRWVWDFWHVQDDQTHHLFYLQAPKALGDPELRHRNATIGHATSTDLAHWTEHGAALHPGCTGAFDAGATWTGSVVRGDDGRWHMFYTGTSFLRPGAHDNVQVIGVATSFDLHTWEKDPSVELRADPRWYEKLGDSSWPEEAWRDPWVYQDASGGWHMLITARSNTGDASDRGVVGHASSPDLETWTVQPPLTEAGEGFGHLEVPQRVTIDGRHLLLFSVHESLVSAERHGAAASTGTWVAPWSDRIRLDEATNLTGPDLYSGRVIDHGGSPALLAFRPFDRQGAFLGGIIDPIAFGCSDDHPSLLDPSAVR
jgi:beta-fructofuranosidase